MMIQSAVDAVKKDLAVSAAQAAQREMAARVCCMNKVRLGSKPMVRRFLTFAHLIACLIIFFQPISYFVLNCYRYSQHCGGLGMLVVNMAALGEMGWG